jgi:Ca2+-binding RTX toxin-like protein
MVDTRMSNFTGTAGNDTLTGTSGDDTFNVSQGGNDTVDGLDGDDTIDFGATLTAADTIDGGAGHDKVILAGDYSSTLTFAATTMVNVEELVMRAGDDYRLKTVDQNVAAGQILTVNASELGAGDTLTFDGRAETDGRFHFIGGAGDDHLVGSTGNDVFDLTEGGNDFVEGGQGNDLIQLGTAFTADDRIQGGAGTDTADITAGGTVTFKATTMVGVENIVFAAASTNYEYVLNDATVAAGTTLTVDGSALTSAQTFNASALTAGQVVVTGGAGSDVLTGGAGNDVFTGGGGNDTFDLSHGGDDTATGGSGNDKFIFGAALSAGDSVDGVSGTDTVTLSGDYSAGVSLTGGLQHITALDLAAGFTYNLTLGHSSIAEIIATGATQVTIDGSEMTGATEVKTGAGNDMFTTDNSASEFNGGDGNDTLVVNSDTASTSGLFEGGDGYDTLVLNGDFDISTMTGVEEIDLVAGHSYDIVISNHFTRLNPDFAVIDGHLLGASDTLTVGSSGDYTAPTLIGGAGDDVLVASSGGSVMTGGGGADSLTGGFNDDLHEGGAPSGNDVFVYNAVSDSTSTAYDTVGFFQTTETGGLNFGPSQDVFRLWFAVTAVDASVTTGTLSTATFDSDLAAAVGPSQLGVHHAVMFSPNAGSLAGDHFLVIDANGVAGYQAGADLVIEINGSQVTDPYTFTTANFTT